MPTTSPARRVAVVLAGAVTVGELTPPSAQRVLSIDDAAVAELQLRLTQG